MKMHVIVFVVVLLVILVVMLRMTTVYLFCSRYRTTLLDINVNNTVMMFNVFLNDHYKLNNSY